MILRATWLVCSLVVVALPAAAAPIKVGLAAPDFTLPDLDGRKLTFSRARGRATLVAFFATWCRPCEQQLPELARLQHAYAGQGLVVLVISVDEERSAPARLLQRRRIALRVLWDSEARVGSAYGFAKLPAAYLVDSGGTVRLVLGGHDRREAGRVEAAIRALLTPRR